MSGETFEFSIRHSGKVYPITLSTDATAADLKSKVEELTQVPSSRQKYMVKGGLTGEESIQISSLIKPGTTVMLLGTPDANLISKPAKKTISSKTLHLNNKFNSLLNRLLVSRIWVTPAI